MLGRRVMERFPDAATTDVRFTGLLHDPLLEWLDKTDPDWVIDCAGAIEGEPDLWIVNALLPHRIRQRLILPSTDHVWDDTEYARSKRLGERGHVIRCAIVDPDGGMLARARGMDTVGEHGREWNGITARTWAKVAEDIIDGKLTGTVLPGSPTITHHDLLWTARKVFGWKTRTIPTWHTKWQAVKPNLMLPPIADQLAEYL
jgi:hypothetical protein